MLWQAPAFAQMSVQERLENMEKRMQYLEKRVVDQDAVIKEKNKQLNELAKETEQAAKEDGSAWFRRIEVSGAVEIEASHTDPFAGNTTNDLVVATAEIGVAAQVHDWVGAEITLLHEEDDTDLEVDVATLTVAPPDGPWYVRGGQYYVPFGTFETNLVSDPLTLEIAETRETAVELGFEKHGFAGSLYGFNGTNKDGGDDRIDNFGAAIGYTHEGEKVTFSVNAGYINDIGDSDNLSDTIADTLGNNNVANHVGGWTTSGLVAFGPFTFIGEYVTATDNFAVNEVAFAGSGAKPEAWQLEAAYGFEVMGKETTVAVAYQGTDEALALGLPETRYLVGATMIITEYVGIGIEWAHDEDYGIAEGGTGNSANTITAQFAVGF